MFSHTVATTRRSAALARADRLRRVRVDEVGDVRDVVAAQRALQPDEVVEAAAEAEHAVAGRVLGIRDEVAAGREPADGDAPPCDSNWPASEPKATISWLDVEVLQLPGVEVRSADEGDAHEAGHGSQGRLRRCRHGSAVREERRGGYESERPDVQALVPRDARRILDLGCSSGVLGAALKQRQGAEVVGIELDPGYARTRARDSTGGLRRRWPQASSRTSGRFDCVIAADVLEHLVDPWTALRRPPTLLEPGGSVVVSVPNVRYALTFWTLLRRGTLAALTRRACSTRRTCAGSRWTTRASCSSGPAWMSTSSSRATGSTDGC